jgi:hypothetical protein
MSIVEVFKFSDWTFLSIIFISEIFTLWKVKIRNIRVEYAVLMICIMLASVLRGIRWALKYEGLILISLIANVLVQLGFYFHVLK